VPLLQTADSSRKIWATVLLLSIIQVAPLPHASREPTDEDFVQKLTGCKYTPLDANVAAPYPPQLETRCSAPSAVPIILCAAYMQQRNSKPAGPHLPCSQLW